MVGVLITGHGKFPTGALSAVALVAGAADNVYALDFVDGMSSAELKENMKSIIMEMAPVEVLVLADLAGGTPFRTAAELKMEITDKAIRVIAGANMPAIIEAAFSCGDSELAELADTVVGSGVEGFVDLDALGGDDEEEPDFGEGL